MVAQGSSIGSYNPAWLSQMLGACSGIHPASYFRSGRNNAVPPGSPAPAVGQPVNLPIKIVFPTETEITGSFGGAPGGGTLFCPVKRWEEPNFPRHLFHRGQSKRPRVAAHTKISESSAPVTHATVEAHVLLVGAVLALHKFDRGSLVPPKHEGWMYLGSHNLCVSSAFPRRCFAYAKTRDRSTPAAWGKLQNGSNGPQIVLNNYELGVMLPSPSLPPGLAPPLLTRSSCTQSALTRPKSLSAKRASWSRIAARCRGCVPSLASAPSGTPAHPPLLTSQYSPDERPWQQERFLSTD